MITLNQVQQLEKKVNQAIGLINQFKTEKITLEERIEAYELKVLKLEEMLASLNNEQKEIEDKFIGALNQLETLESNPEIQNTEEEPPFVDASDDDSVTGDRDIDTTGQESQESEEASGNSGVQETETVSLMDKGDNITSEATRGSEQENNQSEQEENTGEESQGGSPEDDGSEDSNSNLFEQDLDIF